MIVSFWIVLQALFPALHPEEVAMVVHESNEPVTLSFAGDVIAEQSTAFTIESNPAQPFTYVAPYFERSHYSVVNLETPVTHRGTAFPKIYNFRASPKLLDGLQHSGVDLVSLANNHTLDYGEIGLKDTLDQLTQKNLAYMGAGVNESAAYKEHIVTLKGRRIAFLAFSHVLPSVSWYAERNQPGIASGYQLDRAAERVRAVQEQNDYVIVYYHWGEERAVHFNERQQNIAHTLIDEGADAVIGAHPHVLQGFEYYKGKPIAYSLGNFLFPDYVEGRTAETGILTLTLEGNEIRSSFTPFVIQDDVIHPLSNSETMNQCIWLETLSEHIDLSQDGESCLIQQERNGS
ncbi:capsule biosynthesis protein [Pontibacillus halophilus JSM 076056 = DSM 19796]|uniref:Capsule biosynthesis protein n=1 Tax=Pontibacillus halophilus JSM 076056 = DSM 19796 TaxID=1385510 RepID=A0A0A5GN53_9BACI|nr:CapA family protein [Pontibacillus halophilus]KGX92575.1 capsule biosynthesis protein [Pontibacillus halophilus JSM 076056 = DSM 19796]